MHMEKNSFKETTDWNMFWAIENQNIKQLKTLCQTLKSQNENVGMYFHTNNWKNVFTENESKNIKVDLCGVMDFCPIQHAYNIGWREGAQCLCYFDIEHQGLGLTSIIIDDKELLLKSFDPH